MDRVTHTITLPEYMKVVAVEGLDVSGKESLVKELQTRLTRLGKKVIVQDFPRYQTEYGRQIREELQKLPEERNPKRLERLFRMDRVDYFTKLSKEYTEKQTSTPIYLLLDRCHFSNYLYGILQSHEEDYLRKHLIEESILLPKIHMMLLLGRFTEESRLLHNRLIREKKEVDRNETIEIQKFLGKRLEQSIPFVREWMDLDRIGTFPIGSYFTNNPEKPFCDWIINDLISGIIAL